MARLRLFLLHRQLAAVAVMPPAAAHPAPRPRQEHQAGMEGAAAHQVLLWLWHLLSRAPVEAAAVVAETTSAAIPMPMPIQMDVRP